MYHEHFGFFTSPFSLSPHLQFLYRSSAFEETMAHLVYGLEGGEDIILITGEIGTGKTLALYNLSQHITKTYRIALINVTQIDFRELLKLLLVELDVEFPTTADRADLLTALKNELVATMRGGQRLLLIIDEAQNLDVPTLEGVRLLTNLGPPEEQALQVVLSGQPGLRSKVNTPELAQVRQRIRVHYHLDKLGPRETTDYIEHRVKVAGCDRSVFRKEAIEHIHALSDGIPRLVNMVADRALLAAYVDGAHEVRKEHVEDDTTLARSPAGESIAAAVAAQASESPPIAGTDTPETDHPVLEQEPEPSSEPAVEVEPFPDLEPETEPDVVDDIDSALDEDDLEDITTAALAASTTVHAGEDVDETDQAPVDVPEGVEPLTSLLDEDLDLEDILDEEIADDPVNADDPVDEGDPVDEDDVVDEDVQPEDGDDEPEDETPPPMAVKRRGAGARRILVVALIVVALSIVTMAFMAHRRGLITLPLLPAPEQAEVAIVTGDEAAESSTDMHDADGVTDLPGVAMSMGDSLAAGGDDATAEDLVAVVDDDLTTPGNDQSLTASVDVSRDETIPDRTTDAPVAADPVSTAEVTDSESRPDRDLPVPPPGLYVHVGSFRALSHADTFAGQCADVDLLPFIVAATINGQLWYRVHVGPFANNTEAQQAQATVLENHLASWSMIVRLR